MSIMHTVKSRAPLRIGISGGGTDIESFSKIHSGCVINGAINLYSTCLIKLTNNKYHIFTSLNNNKSIKIHKNRDLELKHDDQLDLIIGVYKYFIKYFAINDKHKIEIKTYLDVPGGSGLGGSSTLIVSLIEGLKKIYNQVFDDYEAAEIAYKIERKFLKIPGGKQDQYAAVFGGINYMDFEKNGRVIVNRLNIVHDIINELEDNLVLFYTDQRRNHHEVINKQIKNIGVSNNKTINNLKKIKSECQEMKSILLKNELVKIPETFIKSWSFKKKISDNVTDAKFDKLLSQALKNGAMAGKWSGAGGGGFMIFYTDYNNKRKLINFLSDRPFGKIYNFSFVKHGAQSWYVK